MIARVFSSKSATTHVFIERSRGNLWDPACPMNSEVGGNLLEDKSGAPPSCKHCLRIMAPKAPPPSGPRLVVVASDSRETPRMPFIKGRFVAKIQRSYQ